MPNRKKVFSSLFVGLVLSYCLSGCAGTETKNSDSTASFQPYPAPDSAGSGKYQFPSAPGEAPPPEPGKASISGVIYSFTTLMPIPNTLFYLSRGEGMESKDFPPLLIGPEVSKGDVIGRTDEKGQFFLKDVPPGNYFFVVSAPYNWSVATVSNTDFTPRLIELKPNQKQPLGVVYISWP